MAPNKKQGGLNASMHNPSRQVEPLHQDTPSILKSDIGRNADMSKLKMHQVPHDAPRPTQSGAPDPITHQPFASRPSTANRSEREAELHTEIHTLLRQRYKLRTLACTAIESLSQIPGIPSKLHDCFHGRKPYSEIHQLAVDLDGIREPTDDHVELANERMKILAQSQCHGYTRHGDYARLQERVDNSDRLRNSAYELEKSTLELAALNRMLAESYRKELGEVKAELEKRRQELKCQECFREKEDKGVMEPCIHGIYCAECWDKVKATGYFIYPRCGGEVTGFRRLRNGGFDYLSWHL